MEKGGAIRALSRVRPLDRQPAHGREREREQVRVAFAPVQEAQADRLADRRRGERTSTILCANRSRTRPGGSSGRRSFSAITTSGTVRIVSEYSEPIWLGARRRGLGDGRRLGRDGGAHEPAAGIRRDRAAAERWRGLPARLRDDGVLRAQAGRGARGRAVVDGCAQVGPILSDVVLRAAVARSRAARHWRLAVTAGPPRAATSRGAAAAAPALPDRRSVRCANLE